MKFEIKYKGVALVCKVRYQKQIVMSPLRPAKAQVMKGTSKGVAEITLVQQLLLSLYFGIWRVPPPSTSVPRYPEAWLVMMSFSRELKGGTEGGNVLQ